MDKCRLEKGEIKFCVAMKSLIEIDCKEKGSFLLTDYKNEMCLCGTSINNLLNQLKIKNPPA